MHFLLPSIKCAVGRQPWQQSKAGSPEPANIWLTVAKNEFVGWALNFRVRMLLKGAVSWISDNFEFQFCKFLVGTG